MITTKIPGGHSTKLVTFRPEDYTPCVVDHQGRVFKAMAHFVALEMMVQEHAEMKPMYEAGEFLKLEHEYPYKVGFERGGEVVTREQCAEELKLRCVSQAEALELISMIETYE